MHFNPRSLHGERPADLRCGFIRHAISTHAPRTGSDVHTLAHFISDEISTHAPRTGSDLPTAFHRYGNNGFQPTLPARGATAVTG